MNIKKLQEEMITAMKLKNKMRKDTISEVISAIKKSAIDNNCRDDIPDSLVDAVLIKEQKTAKEMINTCPSNRTELLEEYTEKFNIISEFAPSIESNPEVIKQMIVSTGFDITKQNRGKIMAALKGKVDMKIANKVVNDFVKGE